MLSSFGGSSYYGDDPGATYGSYEDPSAYYNGGHHLNAYGQVAAFHAYEWEEEMDEESQALYYVNNYSGETTWDMPHNFDGPTYAAKQLIASLTPFEIKKIEKIQKMYKARLAKKHAKRRIDFMMIEDHNRASEHAFQVNNLQEAIEELSECHDILAKYRHEELDRWHEVCKRLREMRMTFQSDKYFEAVDKHKTKDIEGEFKAYQDCYSTLKDMHTKSHENSRMASILLSMLKVTAKVTIARTETSDTQMQASLRTRKKRQKKPAEEVNSSSSSSSSSSEDGGSGQSGGEEGHESRWRETEKKNRGIRRGRLSTGAKSSDDILQEYSRDVLEVLTKYGKDGANHWASKQQLIKDTAEEPKKETESEDDRRIKASMEVLWQIKAGCVVKVASWHTSRKDLDSALACYEDALSDVKTFLPENDILFDSLLDLLFAVTLQKYTIQELDHRDAVDNVSLGGDGSTAQFKSSLTTLVQETEAVVCRVEKASNALKTKYKQQFCMLEARVKVTLAMLEHNNQEYKAAIVLFQKALKRMYESARLEQETRFQYTRRLYASVLAAGEKEFEAAQTVFCTEKAYRKAANIYKNVSTFLNPHCEMLTKEFKSLKHDNKYILKQLQRKLREEEEEARKKAEEEAEAITAGPTSLETPETSGEADCMQSVKTEPLPLSSPELECGKRWEEYSQSTATRLWILNGRAVANEASCLERLSNFKTAITRFENSLQMFQKHVNDRKTTLKVKELLLQTHLNGVSQAYELGTVLFQENSILASIHEFDACQLLAEVAEQRARELKQAHVQKMFQNYVFKCLGSRAIAVEKLGDTEKALELLLQTLDVIRSRASHDRFEIITLRRISNVYTKRCSYNGAIATLDQLVEKTTSILAQQDHSQKVSIPASAVTFLRNMQSKALVRAVVTKGVRTFMEQGQLLWAADKIQAVWRGMCGRKLIKQLIFERNTRAATKIQSIMRAYLSRKRFYWKRDVQLYKQKLMPLRIEQAGKLERWWKLTRFRRNMATIITAQAAIDIQRTFRGWLVRRQKDNFKHLRVERVQEKLRCECAIAIQTVWRCWYWWNKMRNHRLHRDFSSDVWYEIQSDAATVIQRPTRAWLGRRKVRAARRQYLENLDLSVKNTHATVIQKRWRGILGRQRFHFFWCVRKVQSWMRMVHVQRHRSIFWKHLDTRLTLKEPGSRLTHEMIFRHIRDAPEHILKSVGFRAREETRTMPIRPPFMIRSKGKKRRATVGSEMKELLADKKMEFLCKKCGQIGRWDGDMCCCSTTPPCRSCVKNSTRKRLYGRPAQFECERKKKFTQLVVHAEGGEDTRVEALGLDMAKIER
jgi:tetratricopeptide (TPR) repeat protein